METDQLGQRKPLEFWAGIECTQNRVGDIYFDQLDRNGHCARPDDIERLARLGAKAIRYPVLWERTAPDSLRTADWKWTDERLRLIRETGMRTIAGLVHHGSGPRHTSLIDPEFPAKLAQYAAVVAERYPWLDSYTPVNEPLTTARFSGLYGVWYPHGRDSVTFVRALLNQCKATVLAMRAIREVNPAAQLVQTDDLAHTSSTPKLRYQADFENERRWITFDLLCGRVDEDHALWNWLQTDGNASAEELLWFSENPCPPDIIGFNYYLTSERFLDERISDYPERFHGGNGRDHYADIECVRVRRDGMVGLPTLLMEAWNRFRIPMAITECHNGCTREEQMRWVRDVWHGCEQAQENGVDVRAVTAWSVFGALDWNSLVTRDNGHYEPGMFDVRAPQPRATALAGIFEQLGRGERPNSPLLDMDGWWQRPERLHHGFAVSDAGERQRFEAPFPSHRMRQPGDVRPMLITGGDTALSRASMRACDQRGIPFHTVSDAQLANEDALAKIFAEWNPWTVIHTDPEIANHALVDVKKLETEVVAHPALLAEFCKRNGIPLLAFSNDQVFGDAKGTPYLESDPTSPRTPYGAMKAAAEAHLLASGAALVIRTGALFGTDNPDDLLQKLLQSLASKGEFSACDRCALSFTYVPHLLEQSLDLLIDGELGLWHLVNEGATTRFAFARMAAEVSGLSDAGLRDTTVEGSRARYSVLATERGQVMPSLRRAMEHYLLHHPEALTTQDAQAA